MSRHLPLARVRAARAAPRARPVQIGLDPEHRRGRRPARRRRRARRCCTSTARPGATTSSRWPPELGRVLDELHALGLLDDDPGPAPTLSAHPARAAGAATSPALALAHAQHARRAARPGAPRHAATVVVRGNDRARRARRARPRRAPGSAPWRSTGPTARSTLDDLTPLGPLGGRTCRGASRSPRRVRGQGAHPTPRSAPAPRPALVVLCSAADADLPWTDPELADDLLADGVPHLAVAGRPATAARVGPARAARAAARACGASTGAAATLDPAWPALADQLRLRHPRARAVGQAGRRRLRRGVRGRDALAGGRRAGVRRTTR